MGNSIEEDIKQVKKLLKELKEERGDIQLSHIQSKLKLSIEHILSDYKRVLKENEELKTANKKLKTLIPINFTPSIKDKRRKNRNISRTIRREKIKCANVVKKLNFGKKEVLINKDSRKKFFRKLVYILGEKNKELSEEIKFLL